MSAHVFQETTHGIELCAETGPVSGFQALDRRIIKLECLARLFRGGACKRGRAAGCRRFGATLRKQRRQRRCERLFHHDLIAIGCDHPFELRQLSLLCPQIERRYIEDRVLDRDDQHVAADHARSQLVPERKLLRNVGILIDASLDLKRPVDELVLGELVDNQLSVVRRIAARCEPCDHILSLARHHWQHEKEFGLRFAGQAHDDVVGHHHRVLPALRLARELPEVFAIVEHLRAVHVVGAIHLRLNAKQVLRVANVLLQIRRHRLQRLEYPRKNPLVGCRDRL